MARLLQQKHNRCSGEWMEVGCSKCYLADEKVGTVVPGGQGRSADGEWEGHRGYCRGGGSRGT